MGGALTVARAVLMCTEAAAQDLLLGLDADRDGAVESGEFELCWNHFARGNAARRGEAGLPGRDWSELHELLTRSQHEERSECKVD